MSGQLQVDEHPVTLDDRPVVDPPIVQPPATEHNGRVFAWPSLRARGQMTGADAVARMLAELGVRRAFGVIGGAIAQFCAAMRIEGIEVFHSRHESGAVFMATEAHFVTDEPVVVFATTGPGATNAITGMVSAAWDGAKIIVVTGGTDPQDRGRNAFQQTHAEALDISNWIGDAPTYMHTAVEGEQDLELLAEQLSRGLASPRGFLASVILPLGMQSKRISTRPRVELAQPSIPSVGPEQIDRVIRRLRAGRFVIWVGHGARKAGPAIRELAERSGAPVIASPRAKGVFPESHPQYLGVTAMFGGQTWVQSYLRAQPPDHILVLGTRLGQTTSCYDPSFEPRGGFIHVDVDPSVFGLAYPGVETLGVTAEIGQFVAALIDRWPGSDDVQVARHALIKPSLEADPCEAGPVHPRALMAAVQRVVVDRSDALVLSETGNAFAWANLVLCFDQPGRYRTGTAFASMCKATSGVVGAALVSEKPAVALVGDGAMLMGNELSTAVKQGAEAKWIVLNDAAYGMVHHGMVSIGMEPFETRIPRTDFAMLATALGATGLRVNEAAELDAALERMLAIPGPVVVDVNVDPDVPPPFRRRNVALSKGWE